MTGLRQHHSAPAAPRDRGRAFGEAEAPRIAHTLANYRAYWDLRAGEPFDPTPWGGQAREAIRAHAPHLAEEIEGIAEGAGLSPDLIGALNARTEILALIRARAAGRGTAGQGVMAGGPGTTGSERTGAERGECSATVALRRGAAPVMVQTWDWFRRFRDDWLVWHIRHEDGRVTRTLTEYGIVGKAGVNDRGLGLLFTILHHRGDGAGIGLPVHVAARAVLDLAPNLYAAAEWLAAARVSASSSINLGGWDGARGQGLTVELSPDGPGYVLPDATGLLVHTNHFLDPRLMPADTEPGMHPDTLLRRDMLLRELAGGVADPEAVMAALDSHLGGDAGLCCHAAGPAPDDEYETLATLSLDLGRGEIAVHPGGPCSRPR